MNRKAEKARRLNQPPMNAEDARKQVQRVKAGSQMGPSCAEEIDFPTHAGEWTAELRLPLPARFLFTVEMQNGEIVAKLEPPQSGEKQRWHPIGWLKMQGFKDWRPKWT